ncbi:hypothetical protein BC332_13608 [Capsicum chinense]|nr:hypothetical protein BC332_13608 [Capsicum chinense]
MLSPVRTATIIEAHSEGYIGPIYTIGVKDGEDLHTQDQPFYYSYLAIGHSRAATGLKESFVELLLFGMDKIGTGVSLSIAIGWVQIVGLSWVGLEGGLVIVGDGSGSGSGSGVVIGTNDAPLTVFETTNYYDYDHTSYTDFSTFSECSACKCQDYNAKHNGVINAFNALTASVKEMASKKGVIPSKRISYPCTPLKIKVDVIIEATAEEHNITVDNLSTISKEEEKVVPYLVDEVYIPINCGDEFHWVLVVVVQKERYIRVYESMSCRRHFDPSSEILKLPKILPTYLDMSDFSDKKVCTDWSTMETYRDKWTVKYVHNATDDQPIATDNQSFTTVPSCFGHQVSRICPPYSTAPKLQQLLEREELQFFYFPNGEYLSNVSSVPPNRHYRSVWIPHLLGWYDTPLGFELLGSFSNSL